MKLFSNSHLYC